MEDYSPPMLLALLSLIFQARVVPIPSDPSVPVVVECPAGHSTRVVFPEPMRRLKGLGALHDGLSVSIVETHPLVLLVRPARGGASGTIGFVGSRREIAVTLRATSTGEDGEVRLEPTSAIETEPGAEPKGEKATPASPDPMPLRPPSTPEKAAVPGLAPPLTPALLLDIAPIRIGRREGLPGQPEMTLVDALRTEEWLWLRFRLRGGAAARAVRIEWEHGELTGHLESDGRELRILVALPRARITGKTRVTIEAEPFGRYRFALSPATLPSFIKELFR